MAKITKTFKIKSVSDFMKQKKIEQARIQKEKAAALEAAKDLKFDTFVRNTAKDILKDYTARNRVQVFDTAIPAQVRSSCSEASVWAPWSKLNRK